MIVVLPGMQSFISSGGRESATGCESFLWIPERRKDHGISMFTMWNHLIPPTGALLKLWKQRFLMDSDERKGKADVCFSRPSPNDGDPIYPGDGKT